MGMIARDLKKAYSELLSYGQEVAIKRRLMKITQAQLAAMCGVSTSTITNIEHGRNQATFHTKNAIDSILSPTKAKPRSYGDRLQSARKRNGYTLEELAKKVGSSAQTLSAVEHGRRNPSVITSIRLRNVLGEI